LIVFGVEEEIELCKNGKNLTIDNNNKKQYVDLICEFRMTKQIQSQIKAFLQGFNILIPHWLASIFTMGELDLLICGMPDIDIADWKKNTDYYGGYEVTSPIIIWFWECVQEFDKEERALLLQFVTGTSKMPVGGFVNMRGMEGSQRFQIRPVRDNADSKLPTAHTCFNQLDLPNYSTKQILKDKLLLAIREGSQGFGIE